MASWTAPKTWAVNETLTAANMNTHVRDNELWLASDHPRARATRTAAQAIASGSDVAISLTGAESFDVGAMHDGVSNQSRLTVPTGGAGVFIVTGYYEMDTGAQTRVVSNIKINATTTIAQSEFTMPSSGGACRDTVAAVINLADADFLELFVNHNAGANVNVTFGALAACWLAF